MRMHEHKGTNWRLIGIVLVAVLFLAAIVVSRLIPVKTETQEGTYNIDGTPFKWIAEDVPEGCQFGLEKSTRYNDTHLVMECDDSLLLIKYNMWGLYQVEQQVKK